MRTLVQLLPTLVTLLASMLVGLPIRAQTTVDVGQSIQAAIEAAAPGDVILVGPGTFQEDLDFQGKPISLVGTGPHTVIEGTGTGPVVTFESGESFDSILDSVTITGGVATAGGGVLISGASPTVIRCTITENRGSSSGSGIHVAGGSQARLFNNLVSFNTRKSGDPHAIQIVGSSPAVVNNTIVRNDSNGILISGASSPVILNNVIARNGSVVGGAPRGRGICDFSGGQAEILFNDFHRNRVSALLRGGKDWRRVTALQNAIDDPKVSGNVDGRPGFPRAGPKSPAQVRCHDFEVCDRGSGRAVDQGHPGSECEDLDGSQNTIGHTGGPFTAGSHRVPGEASCGVATP
jgi:parallel beta-helix repeat protein